MRTNKSSPVLQVVREGLAASMEEACHLDRLLGDVFEIADDIPGLPRCGSTDIIPFQNRWSMPTPCMRVPCPMGDISISSRRAGTDSGSSRIVYIRRVALTLVAEVPFP